MASVTGDKELKRAMSWMAQESPSVMTSGMNAYLRTSVRSVKQMVPSRVRTSFSHRFKRNKNKSIREAKFGAGVGPRNNDRVRLASRPGAGISKRNIHWFVLGTGPRWFGAAFRGSMPAMFPGVVERGARASQAAAMQALIEAARKRIQQKAQQAGRR